MLGTFIAILFAGLAFGLAKFVSPRWNLRFYAALFMGVAAWGAHTAANTTTGLPSYTDLKFATGTLSSKSSEEYCVLLNLEGRDTTFTYQSKAGSRSKVWSSLSEGAKVSLAYAMSGDLDADVFEVIVNNQMIRSYSDVEKSWKRDFQLGWWIFSLSVLVGFILFALSFWTNRLFSSTR